MLANLPACTQLKTWTRKRWKGICISCICTWPVGGKSCMPWIWVSSFWTIWNHERPEAPCLRPQIRCDSLPTSSITDAVSLQEVVKHQTSRQRWHAQDDEYLFTEDKEGVECRHQITKCLRFKMLFARKFRRLSFEMLLHLSSPYERTKRMWDKKNTTNQGPSRSQAANSGHSFVVEAESGTHLSICRSQVLGANDRVVMVPLALLRWISENTENWKKKRLNIKTYHNLQKKNSKLS